MPPPAVQSGCGDGRGFSWWLGGILGELGRFFRNPPVSEWELSSIIYFKHRGLGLSSIARMVYGAPGKRYRVYRILKRLERMGVLECLLEGGLCCGGSGGNGDGRVAFSGKMRREPEDGGDGAKTEAARGSNAPQAR